MQSLANCTGCMASEAIEALRVAGGDLGTALRHELLRLPLDLPLLRTAVVEYCAARGMSAGELAGRRSSPGSSRKVSVAGGSCAWPGSTTAQGLPLATARDGGGTCHTDMDGGTGEQRGRAGGMEEPSASVGPRMQVACAPEGGLPRPSSPRIRFSRMDGVGMEGNLARGAGEGREVGRRADETYVHMRRIFDGAPQPDACMQGVPLAREGQCISLRSVSGSRMFSSRASVRNWLRTSERKYVRATVHCFAALLDPRELLSGFTCTQSIHWVVLRQGSWGPRGTGRLATPQTGGKDHSWARDRSPVLGFVLLLLFQ
jgi:hypothetical protein